MDGQCFLPNFTVHSEDFYVCANLRSNFLVPLLFLKLEILMLICQSHFSANPQLYTKHAHTYSCALEKTHRLVS
jgi:hypothetical protein